VLPISSMVLAPDTWQRMVGTFLLTSRSCRENMGVSEHGVYIYIIIYIIIYIHMISVYPQKWSFNIIWWWFLMGKRDDQPLDFWVPHISRLCRVARFTHGWNSKSRGPGVAQGWRAFTLNVMYLYS
jgi:hypothetical protein